METIEHRAKLRVINDLQTDDRNNKKAYQQGMLYKTIEDRNYSLRP